MRIKEINLPEFSVLSKSDILSIVDKALGNINLNCSKDVLLIIDDHTRPRTIHKIVFDRLIEIVGYERVVVLVASGLHRACSYQEILHKLGDRVKKVRLHSHNPMTSPSLFLCKDDIVIGINTVLPHLHTEYTSCGKLICPGIESYKHIVEFHSVPKSIAQLSMNSHRINFDIGFNVYVNSNADIVWLDVQNVVKDIYRKKYYTIKIPELSSVAILKASIKNTDFQQTMNVFNIMKHTRLVTDGGLIAVYGDTPEGVGIHYLFQQPNGLKPVKYDVVFKDYLGSKMIAFIMPNLNYRAVQEYFDRKIEFFDTMESFEGFVDFMYGKKTEVNVFNGADMMIGSSK